MSGFWRFYWDVLDDDCDEVVILQGNCECQSPGWTFFSADDKTSSINIHVPCKLCQKLVSRKRKQELLIKRKFESKDLRIAETRYYLKNNALL